MKSFCLKLLFAALFLSQSSCYKSYTCQCEYEQPYGKETVDVGEIKATSKEKALQKCPACDGGVTKLK